MIALLHAPYVICAMTHVTIVMLLLTTANVYMHGHLTDMSKSS